MDCRTSFRLFWSKSGSIFGFNNPTYFYLLARVKSEIYVRQRKHVEDNDFF